MCGITGFWSKGQLDHIAQDHIENMTEKLRHRGPDGFGYYVNPKEGLAMGHARLSIIDLDTGDQPLHSPDKSIALTVNGEFYDYKRIRTDLRLEGFDFKTKSDSEIAIPLYKKYGIDFVNHLRGEFALSLYDRNTYRMILTRDRFGIKPLYYYVGLNKVFYGSEIKALLAHPEVPCEFSNQAILHQLMHTMVPGTTAFKNIKALKPGHMLIIRKGADGFDIEEHKYWDMDFPRDKDRDDSLPETHHIGAVREKLTEAVALRLEADVPVGCYLSGGIDSCSMLGLASSMQQSPVKAFTISFDHDAYDESAIARTMAEKTQADQEEILLSSKELYGENYIKTMYHAERTFYNTLGVAKYCMSKRVNECGYRVVVTGEGSDELFGGYPAFKRDYLKFAFENHSELRAGMENTNKLFKGAILSEYDVAHPALDAKCGFTPSWIQSWLLMLKIARPLLHDDILEDLKGYDPVEAISDTFDTDQLEGRHPLDKVQYTWIKTMLECQILNWGGDRVDMANSMESRPAFLDHQVAEVAKNIPPNLRIKRNTEKWVLREAMEKILPEVLYKREKFAFMAPPAHTSESKVQAVKRLIDQFLNPEKLKESGIFSIPRISSFIQNYYRETNPVALVRKDALINHLIGLQIMHEQFVKSNIPELILE